MNRKPPRQLALFDTPRQPRYRRPENDQIWAAITSLRSRGLAVWRGGRAMHIVNGKRCSDANLLELARHENRD